MKNDGLQVIFGGGALGQAVAEELVGRGAKVRVITRGGKASVPSGAESVAGNAADPATTRGHCEGANVIYHCANPGYTLWVKEFPAIHRGIIESAARSGARLVFGDNLYLYGPVKGPITENLPAAAAGPNGRLRAQMASMLMEAHRSGSIRATIGRASDFYGPSVLTSHAGERLFPAALAGKPAQLLSNPDSPHTYTYIKDFAKGLVILGEAEEALGEAWHIPSGETMTTRRFIELVYKTAGTVPVIKVLPRPVLNGMAMVVPLMRALKEQLYQFDQPFVVDHSKFVKAFGDISTPHDKAIAATLSWYRGRLS